MTPRSSLLPNYLIKFCYHREKFGLVFCCILLLSPAHARGLSGVEMGTKDELAEEHEGNNVSEESLVDEFVRLKNGSDELTEGHEGNNVSEESLVDGFVRLKNGSGELTEEHGENNVSEESLVDGFVLLKNGGYACIKNTASASDPDDPRLLLAHNNFTVCLFLRRPESDIGRFFYFYGDSTSIAAYHYRGDAIALAVNETMYTFAASVFTGAWSTLCFGCCKDTNQAWMVLNGVLLEIQGKHEYGPSLGTSEMLCLGWPHMQYSQMEGWVGGLSVRRGQEVLQQPDSATCRSLFSWATHSAFSWNGHNNILAIQYPLQELCSQDRHQVFWLDVPADYLQTHSHCEAMGGQLPTQDTDLTPTLITHCPSKHPDLMIWVAGGLITAPPQGLQPPSCPVLTANGTITSHLCLAKVECSACIAPAWIRYTLYGPLQHHDRYFFLNINPDGVIYFQGLNEVSVIKQQNGSWVLSSPVYHKQWHLPEGAWPVGRHQWHSEASSASLTLTVCSPFQFSDHNGHCIPRNSRCDRNIDSHDMSDELDCASREANTRSRELPYNSKEEDRIVIIKEIKINNIKIANTAIHTTTLKINVILSWKAQDHQFQDVHNLHFFTCEEFWHPEFIVNDLKGEINPNPPLKRCGVIKGKSEYLDMDDNLMGRALKGGQANIYMGMKTDITFDCDQRMYRYPFGRYSCSATLMVLHFPPIHLKVDTDIEYEGNYDLVNYELLNITVEESGMQAIITMNLKCLYDYFLLTSFAPSLLMFVISYATFFFPLEAFGERVMASLTALLVLAALFTQASESYIQTAYYKLIDLWYAVIIMLCFVVVMCNVVINALRTTRDYSKIPFNDASTTNPPMTCNRRAKTANKACVVLLFMVFLVVVVVFILYANEII